MPVDFKVRPTVNGVNVALLSELGGGVSGSYQFTPTSAFERHRITDSNILSSSKIIGKIKRPYAPVQFSNISDNFNRADENPLSNGGKWSLLGVPLPSALVSNQVANFAGDGTQAYSFWVEEAWTDAEVYYDLTTAPGSINASSSFAILLRATSGSPLPSHYAIFYFPNSGTVNTYYSDSAGSLHSLIGSVSVPSYISGMKLGARIYGNTIEFFMYRSGAWSKILTVTDSTLSSGYVGFRLDSPSSIDNFGVQDIGVPQAVHDAGEANDYGWAYDFNVAKIANGYFDVNVETSLLGESADSEFGYNSYLKLVTRSGALGENAFGVLNSDPQKIATFTPLESGFLNYIDLFLFVVFPGIPTDNVKLSIQTDNAGAPSGTSIMVSKNVISVNRERDDRYKFIFEQRIATQSKCWLVLERTGALSDSDHYGVQIIQDAATSQYGESVYIPDLGGWFSQNAQGFNYIASYHRSLFDESPTLFYKVL